MAIQKPSKHALREKGPWNLHWTLPGDRPNWVAVPRVFHERQELLSYVKKKIRALRRRGVPSRLNDFWARRAGDKYSVVLGLLRDWDAQFRPDRQPHRKRVHPSKKVLRHIGQLRDDFLYLNGAFKALHRLAASLK